MVVAKSLLYVLAYSASTVVVFLALVFVLVLVVLYLGIGASAILGERDEEGDAGARDASNAFRAQGTRGPLAVFVLMVGLLAGAFFLTGRIFSALDYAAPWPALGVGARADYKKQTEIAEKLYEDAIRKYETATTATVRSADAKRDLDEARNALNQLRQITDAKEQKSIIVATTPLYLTFAVGVAVGLAQDLVRMCLRLPARSMAKVVRGKGGTRSRKKTAKR